MLNILKRFKIKEWLQLLVAIFFILIQVGLDLKIPGYMAVVTKLVQSPGNHLKEILLVGSYMLLCAVGSLIAVFIVGYLAARLAAILSYRLRSDLYDKVNSFSLEEIKLFSVSSLITRTTNDITQIQIIVLMAIQVLIKAPIMATWAIMKIIGKSWQWSLATSGAILILMLMVLVLIIFALPKFKLMQKLIDNLNQNIRENLIGVRVVRAYNAENYQLNKFGIANTKLTNTNLFTSRLMAIIMPSMQLIMNGLPLAIYWIGAYLINGATSGTKLEIFTDMVVYSSYAMQVVMSFMRIAMLFVILPRIVVSIKRVNEVLTTESKLKDGALADDSLIIKEVEFKNVSFKYPAANEYILHNISFKAKPGETIAFIGSTGSGKSTLINLIPRFYDVTTGSILINGKNIKEYKQKTLYNKIGYVPQQAVIFGGTIKSNLAFGESSKKEITKQDLKKASKQACASEYIEKMKDKYDAFVAQAGTNLSGGQKQRLAIARALVREPEILIFDDSFSALDYKTERKIRATLGTESKKVITFIVAQRIGTIRGADKIIVLDEGEIVGLGTHNELIKSCQIYQEIAQSQLTKEEIINAGTI